MRGDDAIDYPEHQARDHRTAGEPAEATIYRFRDCVNEFNRKANRGYQLSFSKGVVAVDNKKKNSIEELLSQADSLMYENKRGRRNHK